VYSPLEIRKVVHYYNQNEHEVVCCNIITPLPISFVLMKLNKSVQRINDDNGAFGHESGRQALPEKVQRVF
jgi:hypothetical protein